jgi:hypothetical protein
MAPTDQKSQKDLSSLKITVAAVSALLAQLEAAVKTPPTSTHDDPKSPSDVSALSLSHDAAKLIRAHSTKLSLLIINAPFTPSAISTVLRELASGPLPALATAVEICDSTAYTKVMQSELIWRTQKVFTEFGTLLREVPLDGKVLNTDQKNGTGDTVGKGSLASTGVVWQACDNVMELKNLDIAGLVVKKAEQYRDTLKDAIEELQEWGEEEGDEEDEEDEDAHEADDEEDGEFPNAIQDEIDALFGSSLHIPADDPNHIRPRLESSIRRLKLIVLMYNAVIKRRFKPISALSLHHLQINSRPDELEKSVLLETNKGASPAQRLDAALEVLKKIPDIADELANAFYNLDAKEIDRRMDECFFTGVAATELLATSWSDKDDEFTVWVSILLPKTGI